MPFGRPIDYDSFYLLPKAVNARPNMRKGPPSSGSGSTPSKKHQQQQLHRSSMHDFNLAKRLSAKAKSFIPKTSTYERKASGLKREPSPNIASDTTSNSSNSQNSSPEISPSISSQEMDSWSVFGPRNSRSSVEAHIHGKFDHFPKDDKEDYASKYTLSGQESYSEQQYAMYHHNHNNHHNHAPHYSNAYEGYTNNNI